MAVLRTRMTESPMAGSDGDRGDFAALECLYFRASSYDWHNRTAVGKNSGNSPRFRKLDRPFCRSFEVEGASALGSLVLAFQAEDQNLSGV